MKLSRYAKQIGVTYKTAWRWFKDGKLPGYQTATGTIIIEPPTLPPEATGIALYARVSSSGQKADAEQQLRRLRQYAAARGYQVSHEVVEIASGLNEQRPKLLRILTDPAIGLIIVEHQDRLTRFGFHYVTVLLAMQQRRIETIFPTDTGDDLIDDFVAIITSMATRLYGLTNNKRRTEHIQQCIKRCTEHADGDPLESA